MNEIRNFRVRSDRPDWCVSYTNLQGGMVTVFRGDTKEDAEAEMRRLFREDLETLRTAATGSPVISVLQFEREDTADAFVREATERGCQAHKVECEESGWLVHMSEGSAS